MTIPFKRINWSVESLSPQAENRPEWTWHGPVAPTPTQALWADAAEPETTTVDELPLIDAPHAVHLPDHYEPGYSYPLIVWFHDDDSSETELGRFLPQISDRNYLGLAVRGNVAREQGHGWSLANADFPALVEQVRELCVAMRRRYHVHSERIYLAGHGAGALVALAVLLAEPDWFAGAACLKAGDELGRQPLTRYRDLAGKRVLLSTTLDQRAIRLTDLVATGQVLYNAGMQVGTRIYEAGAKTPSTKMLRDIDRWVMQGLDSAVGV